MNRANRCDNSTSCRIRAAGPLPREGEEARKADPALLVRDRMEEQPGGGGWSRRQFLTRSAAFLGSVAAMPVALGELFAVDHVVGGATGFASDDVYLYANESGRGDGPSVLGMIYTSDPRRHEASLYALKREHRFIGRRLRYSSTDRRKASYAEAAIDYLLGNGDLGFIAAVNAPTPRTRGRNVYREGQVLRAARYRHLVERTPFDRSVAATVRLRLQPRTVDGASDRAFQDEVQGDFRKNLTMEYVDVAHQDLLQLGDFLTGSIYGDVAREANGIAQTGRRHSVKESLIRSLKERLRIRSLSSVRDVRGFHVVDLRGPGRSPRAIEGARPGRKRASPKSSAG